MPALIIHGPQGTGKTRHAAAIAKHYGKTEVLDDRLFAIPIFFRPMTDHYLILTNDDVAAAKAARNFGYDVISIADALQAIGADQK